MAATKQLVGNQEKLIKALQQQNAGLIGQKVRGDFDATIAELKREGHQLPADDAIAGMFSTCFSAADPQKAVASYVSLLKATPKRESLAGVGTVFGATGGAAADPAATAPAAGADAMPSLFSVLGDMNASTFSSDDLKLGEALLKGIATKKK